MCAALEREFHLQSAALLLNLASPLLAATDAEVEQLRSAVADSPGSALHFALERGLLERERAAALRSLISAPAITVKRVRSWTSDLDLLEQVGRDLGLVPVEL